MILLKETPSGHNFPSYIMQLGVELIVHARDSFRGAEKTFQLFSKFFELPTPSYSSIRNWLFRLGLYILKYQEIPYRKDWILIFDHTVELDHKKCLVTLLVSREDLEKHGYSLTHCSVLVVDIEVMTSSTGDLILQKLLDISSRVGIPMQIVCDRGADLQKGIRLFGEIYPEVISTYDVTHKMGCILKKHFEKNTHWMSYSKHCTTTIQHVQQTELRFLCPTKQKVKARFLSIHERIEYGMNLLNYEKEGDFSKISPCFQLKQEDLNQLNLELFPEENSTLSSFSSQKYSNRQSFQEALLEHVSPCLFEKIKKPILKIADQGRKRYLEKFSWIFSYEQYLISSSQVIRLVKIVEKQLKTEGIHQKSKKQFEKNTENLLLTNQLAKKIKKEIIFYLDEEGSKIPPTECLLGTSDVIESIFEKYKFFTSRNPAKELGKLVLTIPVFTTKITLKLIKEAMETVKASDVKKYAEKTFGTSMLSKRKSAFNASCTHGTEDKKVREISTENAISKKNQMGDEISPKSKTSNKPHVTKKVKIIDFIKKKVFKSAS